MLAACVPLLNDCRKECKAEKIACGEECEATGDCACHQTVRKEFRECRKCCFKDFQECMQPDLEFPRPFGEVEGVDDDDEISESDAVPTPEIVEIEEEPTVAGEPPADNSVEKLSDDVSAASEEAEPTPASDGNEDDNAAAVQVESRSGTAQGSLEELKINP